MEYRSPGTLDEAVSLLAGKPGARVLAGGTDLLVQMKSGRSDPPLLVDVKRIEGLCDVDLSDDGLLIGAAAPAQSITERADIAAIYPGLVEAVDLIGSTQIQGRCSLGGNLCNASPAADTVPALIACGALCNIVGPAGERTIAVDGFNTGPGSNGLAAGELLVSLFVPRPAPGSADAYLRFIPRTEMDIAVVGAGVSVSLDGEGRCTGARVAIGAVAPTALLVPEAAAAVIGSSLEAQALVAAGLAASEAASPITDKRGTAVYRRKVVAVLVRRALAAARDRALAAGGQ
jgi:carbon-monoxide dehydrogenase medium subunit